MQGALSPYFNRNFLKEQKSSPLVYAYVIQGFSWSHDIHSFMTFITTTITLKSTTGKLWFFLVHYCKEKKTENSRNRSETKRRLRKGKIISCFKLIPRKVPATGERKKTSCVFIYQADTRNIVLCVRLRMCRSCIIKRRENPV